MGKVHGFRIILAITKSHTFQTYWGKCNKCSLICFERNTPAPSAKKAKPRLECLVSRGCHKRHKQSYWATRKGYMLHHFPLCGFCSIELNRMCILIRVSERTSQTWILSQSVGAIDLNEAAVVVFKVLFTIKPQKIVRIKNLFDLFRLVFRLLLASSGIKRVVALTNQFEHKMTHVWPVTP